MHVNRYRVKKETAKMNIFPRVLLVIIFTSCAFLIPVTTFADYDEYGNPVSSEDAISGPEIERRVRTKKYNLTPKTIKSSTLRALLNYSWEIINVSKDHIEAENRKAFMTVTFKDNTSLTLVLKSKSGGTPNEKWLRSMNKFLDREFTFHHYNQRFNE